MTRQYAN